MGYKKGEVLKTAFETYTILNQRGSGGSGEVYEISDSEGSLFAVKVLDQAKATRSRLKRFKNEIHFCSKNVHRNIVPVLASGITARGATFYVMPLYSGTLRSLMSKGIAPESTLRYFGQILDGLEAAHLQGVWHRDVKPENILLSEKDDTLVVADFGIAHFEEEELLTAVETADQERLANFVYSAPEQRSRGQRVDSKADIYALALILNEMFSGNVPQGTSFRRISERAGNFAYLDGIVDLMLRQDPSARPSIEDVKRDLIARGNEFLSLQRLNSLRSEVVPETEVDDFFIRNPIKIIGVDYQGGHLSFKLSAAPPPNWIMAFQRPNSGWQSYLGAGPEYFSFNRDEAQVRLSGGMDPKQLTGYANNYVDLANRQYAEALVAQHRKNLAAQHEHKRKQIQAEEERQKSPGPNCRNQVLTRCVAGAIAFFANPRAAPQIHI